GSWRTRGDRSTGRETSLSAAILTGSEPHRDAIQQAQGVAAETGRANRFPSLPQDRLIRSKPHRPRSPQLLQACRLCVKSTGICSRLDSNETREAAIKKTAKRIGLGIV